MRVQNRDPSRSGLPTNEDDPVTSRPAGVGGGPRKKGTGVRAWLLLDGAGQTQVVEAGKHAIMRRTGLPARDLRILDPILSYPSTVLGRERAIVINLEHIKAIITAQEVLLLNARDPSVTPFVEELRRRILRHHQAAKAQEGDGDESNWTKMYDSEEAQSRTVSPPNHQEEESKAEEGKQEFRDRNGMKVLPFEFVALEACLEAACGVLDNEAKTLELEAHPALDRLTSKISTLNLERVRQIKSRLVTITGRVQKVRDELEHLLDDDGDMAEMYLTDKLDEEVEDSSASSMNDDDDDDDDMENDMDDSKMRPEMTSERGSRSRTTTTYAKQVDVEELEMLLEAYFVQIDGTLNKLSTLREYVDDTEDYINIMLDDKQNQLLQMGVMLTMATLVANAVIVVTGLFGMNITIGLFDQNLAGNREFFWTAGGSTMISILMYVVAIAWCKRKRLLE